MHFYWQTPQISTNESKKSSKYDTLMSKYIKTLISTQTKPFQVWKAHKNECSILGEEISYLHDCSWSIAIRKIHL